MTPWEAYQQKKKQKNKQNQSSNQSSKQSSKQSDKQSGNASGSSASANERISPWEDYKRRTEKNKSTYPKKMTAPEGKGYFSYPIEEIRAGRKKFADMYRADNDRFLAGVKDTVAPFYRQAMEAHRAFQSPYQTKGYPGLTDKPESVTNLEKYIAPTEDYYAAAAKYAGEVLPYGLKAEKTRRAAAEFEASVDKLNDEWQSRLRAPEEIRAEIDSLGVDSLTTGSARRMQLEEELGIALNLAYGENYDSGKFNLPELGESISGGSKRIAELEKELEDDQYILENWPGQQPGHQPTKAMLDEQAVILQRIGQNKQELQRLKKEVVSKNDEYQYYLGRVFADEQNDPEAERLIAQGKEKHQSALEGYHSYLENSQEYKTILMLTNEAELGTALAPFRKEARNHYPLAVTIDSLSDEDQRTFYYLVGRGMDEFALQFANECAVEERKDQQAEIRKWAGSGVGKSILATAGSLLLLPVAWSDPVFAETAGSITGLSSAGVGFGGLRDNLRAGVSDAMNDWGTISERIPVLGGKGLGDLYQLGMSMADSYLSGSVMGAGASYVLGGSAFASAYNQAIDKGASIETALMQGVAQGVSETLFEYLSLDKLFNGDVSGSFIRSVLQQGGIEASEELCTSLANHITDRMIMGEKSEYEMAKQEYMKQGKSREEASRLAKRDFIETLVADGLGGFISGGGSGAVHTAEVNASYFNEYGTYAKELIAKALDMDSKSSFAQQMKQKLDNGKALSGEQVRRLVDLVGEDAAYQIKMDAANQEDAEVLPDWEQYEQEHSEDRFQYDPSAETFDQLEDMQGWREDTYAEAQTYTDQELARAMEEQRAIRDDDSMDNKSRAIAQHHLDALELVQEQRNEQTKNAALTEQQMNGGLNYGGAEGLNDSSQRNEGLGARGSVGGLEESTGRSITRGTGKTEAAILADLRANAASQSAKEIGIINGSETADLRVISAEKVAQSPMWSGLQADAESNGHKLVLVAGRMETVDPVTKKRFAAEGIRQVAADGTVTYYVRADKLSRNAEQIYKHEDFHDIVHNNPELLGDLVLALEMEYGRQEILRLVSCYVEAFDGIYGRFEESMTEEQEYALTMVYMEEVFADVYGDIRRGKIETASAQKILQSQTDSVQRAAQNRKATETKTAPPGQLFSIEKVVEGEKGMYENCVVLDTDLFNHINPRRWGTVLGEFVYKNLAGQRLTMFDENGNAETVEVARANDRVKKSGAKNSHKVIDKLARYHGDNIKALGTVHLSELLTASDRESRSDEKNHQWMDENGWIHRHVFIVNRDGMIYDALLNIADGRDRRIIYEINNIRAIDRRKGTAHGAVPSTENGRGSHINSSSFGDSLSENMEDVKQNFSVDDEAYLSAVEDGDMETAQRMVDEAAKKAGYTSSDDWRMAHRAPTSKGDTACSMDQIDTAYGGDGSIYSFRAVQYYGEGRDYDRKAFNVIRSARSNPDKMITVYRAVPTDIQDSRVRNGDWVSITREYAEEHGERTFDDGYRILENKVPAKHIYGNGNSIHEWGYDNGDPSEVYKNAVGNVKLAAVTYDDNGNVIPLSKRFNEDKTDIRYSVDDEARELDEGYARKMTEGEEPRRGKSEPEWEAVRSSMDEYNAAAKEAKEQRAEKNSITALKNRIQKNEQMLRELSNMRTMAKKSNFLSRSMDKNIEIRRSIIQETLEIDQAALKVKQEAKKQEDKRRKQKRREEEIQKVKARQATEEMVNAVMELFFTKRGERYDVREMLNELADQIVKDGRITNDVRDQLLRVLYENSEIVVEPDEYFGDIRRFVQHVKIYVPDSVRAEFGDDWNGFRNATFGQRIYLTNNPNDMGINTVAEELRGIFGNVFAENASLMEQLERIYELAEEGKAEKLSLPEMMRIERDNFGWSVEDQMDEMERKLDKILQTFSEKASFEIDIQQKTLRVMNKQREGFRKTLELRRDRVAENALMNQVLKRAQKLKAYQKRATPSVKRMIDEQIGDLDTLARSISSKGLEDMQQIIDNYNQTAAELGDAFIANPEIVDRFERVKQRHISDMSVEEVRALGEALTGVIRQIQNYNRMVSEERNIFLTDMANRAQQEIVESEGSQSAGYLQKFMQGQLNAKVLFGKISGYVDGAWKMLSERLSHGEELRRQYQMRAMELFDTFLSDKGNQEWLKKASGKNAVWETVSVKGANVLVNGAVADTTDSIELTPMMKVSLLMHSKNADNLRHIGYYEKEGDIYVLRGGGVTIPDKELYKKGKLKEAYARGQVLVIPPDAVRAIAWNCTAQEKAFTALLTKYFDNMAKSAINEVSLQVDGWERACVQNYFPIQSDKAFIVTENGLIMQDLSLQGSPFLKERSHKGKNPMYLFDATDVLYRNIAQVSKYYGLTRGLRDLHAVINATYYQTDKNVEDSTAENELLQKVKKQEGWGKVNVGSVEKALVSKWGPEAKDYIERLSAHLQGGKSEGTVLDELLTKLRGRYARSVISFNPSSVAKQVSSYLVAYSYLDAEDLVKGVVTTNYFGNAKEAVMNLSRYSAVYWYRNQGNVNTEIKEYTERKGMLERLPLGFQWTQMMDSAVTRRLLAACMHHVSRKMGLQPGSQESIDSGTDRYWSEVAKLFNKVVLDTQSNTSTMERPDILRGDKHGIAKFITMFRGDPSQQHNLQVEARGMWKAAKKVYKTNPTDANKKRLKDAQKHLAKTTSAVFMGQLTVGVITSLLAWLTFRDKDYYDEEGKFLWKKFFGNVGLNAAEGYAGLILGLDWISSLVESAITGEKWYGPEVLGFESVKTFGEDVVSFFSAAFNLDYREGKKQLRKVAKSAGLLFGIPVTNIEKYLLAATRTFAPELAERWENIWDETEKNDLQYRSPRAVEEAISVLLDNRVDGLSNEDKAEIARLYIAGGIGAVPTAIPTSFEYTNEDGEKVTVTMSPKQKEEYREAWNEYASAGLSEILTSEQYESADDEGKTVYIDKLYKLATQMARNVVEPKKEPEKWVQQGLDAQKNGVSLGEYVIFRVDLSGADGKDEKGETVTGLEMQRSMDLIEAMGWTDKQEKAIWMDVVASDSSAAITEALTKAGMTWDQVNDIVVMKDNKLDRMAAIAATRQSDSVKVKAMCVFASEKEKKLLTVGLKYGIKPEWYTEVLKNADANESGKVDKAEAEKYIRSMGLTSQEQTALYQMVTDSKIPEKDYPFYKLYAEGFYYEVHKDDPE